MEMNAYKIIAILFLCACTKQEVDFCGCINTDPELFGEMITNYLQKNGQENFVNWLEEKECVIEVTEYPPLKTYPLTYFFDVEFTTGSKTIYISDLKFLYYGN
jgi:hypothetical protein